jgi:hypothetical protein
MAYTFKNENREKPVFEPAPKGKYVLCVTSYDKYLTKKGGFTAYDLCCEIEGLNGRTVYDEIVIVDSDKSEFEKWRKFADWKTEAFLKSTSRFNSGAVTIDENDESDRKLFIDARGWANVDIEEYTGKDGKKYKKNIVTEWLHGEPVPPSPNEF